MNALPPQPSLTVRTLDPRDAREAERVEGFLRDNIGATPFHRPAWSAAIEQGCGQKAYYIVAERRQALAGLLPLTHVRSRLFGQALVSAGFAVGGGILATDDSAKAALAAAAEDLGHRLGCANLELRGGPVPEGWQCRDDIYAGFARPLPKDDEAILKSIPRKQRAEVRRALQNGLEVRAGREARDRRDHYRVYSELVRNLGTPVFPRRLFEAMLQGFGVDADIQTVCRNGEPLSSVFSLYYKNAVYPYWGGGTFSARQARSNELLYFELMRRAAARGCTRFDFGRSKVGTGPYAFKKNWGFEPQPLAYAIKTADGAAPRDVNPLSPKYRLKIALWQKLPLWAANRLGPPIACGLG